MTTENFADRLLERCRAARSQVVVGLDPRFDRLPDELSRAAVNDFGETPRAVAEAFLAFNRAVIDAAGDVVAAFKPQAAFYEQYGCEGMRAYARTIAYARGQGHIVIGDVKRNDIASTAAAYAAGHLGGGQGGSGSNDFVADAITVNPYLGADGVEPFLQAAASGGRGVFALVKTSNPSSRDIQDADCEGAPLYERVARLVEQWGGPHRGRSGYSSLGAVVGATFPEELGRLRELMPHAVLLVPGFGAQGGGVQDVLGAFDADGLGAVVNASRSVIFAWERNPWRERYGAGQWSEAVRAAAAAMREQIWGATH